MLNIIIWGVGAEYDLAYNQIKYEEFKKNIKIICAVDDNVRFSSIDNIKIVSPDVLEDISYDYIIVYDYNFNNEKNKIMQYGIAASQIIDGRVFQIPCFDFKRYIEIWKSNISIVADNCWGAYTYNTLAMEFKSPFILCFVSSTDHANELIASDEYLRMLQSLDKYLNAPVEMVRDMPENAYWCWPKGCLKLNDEEIRLNFNHANSFTEAKESWERRLKRFNWENIFVKMTIYNDEQAEKFDSLPFKKKVGFYHKDSKYESIVNMCEWNNIKIRQYEKYAYSFDTYLMRAADTSNYNSKPYDVFKLLLGEKEFLRKK